MPYKEVYMQASILFSENLFGTTKYIIAFVQLHLLILQYDYLR